jgi:two-component system, NarL family, sensor kinase
VRRGREATPVSVGRLVLRFALSGLVALIVVSVFTAYASRNVGLDIAVSDARRVTWVSAKGIVEPVLTNAVLADEKVALQRLDDAVRRDVLGGFLVRVKIWNHDGVIVYADEPRLIGNRFALDDEEMALFGGAPAVAHVSNLSEPENRFETDSKLLEVYQLSSTQEGTPVLFEAYFRYSGVTGVGRDLWHRFAPIAIGSLIAIELVQIPFAWQLARRLRAGQAQRERLLGHAIDASNAERRRIAGDLHDGVVQELTGVSLSLGALARTTPAVGPALDGAADSIRESMKSLRTLLVDIYPPNLYEEGIESALDDLLGQVAKRGIATALHVDLDERTLDPHTAELLYRSAQEALRNVVAHSGASSTRVELARRDDVVVITIDDDGRGFAPQQWQGQADDGHFGLKAMSDLIRDAGGRLVVRSTSGLGSQVLVEVPGRTRATEGLR